MIIKLHMKKAFNRLEWSFIKDILRFFNFPPNLTNLILQCVSTSTLQVLVNGKTTNSFTPSRGIRRVTLFPPMSSYFAWTTSHA